MLFSGSFAVKGKLRHEDYSDMFRSDLGYGSDAYIQLHT